MEVVKNICILISANVVHWFPWEFSKTDNLEISISIYVCGMQGKKGPVAAPRTWTVGSQFKVGWWSLININ